ncbi:MAG: PKD domain-containing protein, partial [Bacteroidia bacterium]
NTPCANQQALNLNCTPTNLSNYVWAGPASYSATGSNPSVPVANVTTALAGIYTVTVTDNNLPACTNTAVVNVTINPVPNVTVTTSPICLGQTINLVASGGVNYTWSHSSETPPFTSNQNPLTRANATFDMAGNYIVTATDANGCIGAGFATVIVNGLPVITATTNAICFSQQTATLTASGASTYTWTGSYITLPNNNPTTANPNTTNVYTVTATDINTCVGTATTMVTVYTLPTVTTPTVMPDCIPLCHSFIVTSPAASSISTYSWSFGNGSPSSAQATPTRCYTVAGSSNVVLIVTDTNGCTNVATTTVTAFSVPTAAFTYGEQPVSVLAPEVHFDNQSTPGLNYSWTFGDIYNNKDSVTNPIHTYPTVGFYTVTLTASSSNGCSATTQEVIQIFDDYVLYVPNAFTPNEDGKNEIFKPVGEGITDYKLYIFDRWGSLIFFSDDINKGWDGTYQAKGDQVVQQDVFVWKIQLQNVLKESKNLTGTVTLIK